MSSSKENDGRKKGSHWAAWDKLDKETRDQYQAIEDRVRDKVKRGLL